MRKDTKFALDGVFDQYAEAQRKAKEVQEAKESAEDAFLREFLAVRSSIVEPAMKEIGEYLKSKGCGYTIQTTEDGRKLAVDSGGRDIEASITLNLQPPDQSSRAPYNTPHFSVHCNKREKRVWFHESTITERGGGHAGSAGEAKLADVTADLIQKKILAIIAKVFG
jgi:hypothetical protein